MKPLCPSEDFEGATFASWLEKNEYLFSHLSQNTFTRSFAVKAKLKRQGVKKGIPDYLIRLKAGPIMFLELKRAKGGRVSKEQKTWLEALNEAGVTAVVAEGSEQAIEKVLAQEVAKSRVEA